jgi:hypothetical protein
VGPAGEPESPHPTSPAENTKEKRPVNVLLVIAQSPIQKAGTRRENLNKAPILLVGARRAKPLLMDVADRALRTGVRRVEQIVEQIW